MATINTELKEYHFYGKDMVEGVYYRKADVDRLIESLKADHNVELPDPPKPRRATNRELARWLAQGNGEHKEVITDHGCCMTYFYYPDRCRDVELQKGIKVRKWEDTEWHEPDVFYMGLEVVDEN